MKIQLSCFHMMMWICMISIDLESLNANVHILDFLSSKGRKVFLHQYTKHIAKRDLEISLFWQDYILWGRMNYLYILSNYYQFNDSKIMHNVLNYATWHFIMLSVNSARVIFCETFLRGSRQTLTRTLSKAPSRPRVFLLRVKGLSFMICWMNVGMIAM